MISVSCSVMHHCFEIIPYIESYNRSVHSCLALLPRSQLTIGLGSSTRCLEKDQLRLVIVDRSTPTLLHRHLIQLAAVRQCPAVAANRLSQTLASLLGMRSLVAIGFKVLESSQTEIPQRQSLLIKLKDTILYTNTHK